jgi:ABC-type uncharacterized transport system permease subunit
MLLKRSIATLELLLIAPASLFMLALFFRSVQAEQHQPAQAAAQFVDWFAARPRVGLQIFLMILPFAALIIGASTAFRIWRNDQQLRQRATDTLAGLRANASFLLISAATLIAGAILAIVTLHILTD